MDFLFENRFSDSPLVESVWRTYSAQAGTFTSQAASTWEMVIWHYQGETRLTVRGPEVRATPAESPADADFFGIQFKMGTYMPHLPLNTLVSQGLTLPEATGKAFWLNSEVWEIPTFNNADTFVERLIRKGVLVCDPMIVTALADQPPDLSPRALQYRFLQKTGLTQNTIRQINRAREAAVLLQQGQPILDVVYATGYFDQAHLTHALKRFIGQTPAQLARQYQLA